MRKPGTTLRDRAQLALGLAALTVIASGCGLGVSLPFTGSHSPAKTHGHQVRQVALAHGRKRTVAARRHPRFVQRRAYARHITPLLARDAVIFHRAASALQSNAGNLGALDSLCSTYLSAVQVQMSYADGVPHPFTWFSAAGTFHHQVLGVYHEMAGALVACQTAVGGQDGQEAATAASDAATAATHMNNMQSYSRWLATH